MNLVTKYKYAKLCGVTPNAIYNRVEQGLLEVVKRQAPDGKVVEYIDVDANPPERIRAEGGGRKPKEEDEPETEIAA